MSSVIQQMKFKSKANPVYLEFPGNIFGGKSDVIMAFIIYF